MSDLTPIKAAFAKVMRHTHTANSLILTTYVAEEQFNLFVCNISSNEEEHLLTSSQSHWHCVRRNLFAEVFVANMVIPLKFVTKHMFEKLSGWPMPRSNKTACMRAVMSVQVLNLFNSAIASLCQPWPGNCHRRVGHCACLASVGSV